MSVKGITPQELAAYGIHNVSEIVYNPSYDLLFEEETKPTLEGYERGTLTTTGAIAVDTGIFTGVHPKINILSAMLSLRIPCGGPIRAKVKMIISL